MLIISFFSKSVIEFMLGQTLTCKYIYKSEQPKSQLIKQKIDVCTCKKKCFCLIVLTHSPNCG